MQPWILLALFATKAQGRLMFSSLPPPLSPSVQSCFPASQPPPWTGAGFSPCQILWGPARPFLHPVEVPLKTSTILWCFSHPTLFCIIRVLAEGTLLITNKDVQLDSYHKSPLIPSRPGHSASFQSNSVFAYPASLWENSVKDLIESGQTIFIASSSSTKTIILS